MPVTICIPIALGTKRWPMQLISGYWLLIDVSAFDQKAENLPMCTVCSRIGEQPLTQQA